MYVDEIAPNFNAKCNCFVRNLSQTQQFTTHYGAHALTCPVYRPSGDPLDAARDSAFRSVEGRFPRKVR